ncbi:alpha/beta-hydrolase [Microthyrium microscopicum]|uniref:cutinase n=1 Tax=Microthyrium microscopicum TaxID=703497 RepID=A0A6A6UFG1_9PEZI|nr:alpha/beta-hydrolase [Microthyrium microscopicum]
MHYLLALTALAATIVDAVPQAPTAPATPSAPPAAPKGICRKTNETQSGPDPLKQFVPGSAVFPCDMGVAIPLPVNPRKSVRSRLEREHKKGGLDFVWYAFNAYEKGLFPYYLEIKRLNPHKDVFIVEDNVPLHHKARRLLQDQIDLLGIEFRPTPANSLDLYPIETLWNDLGDIIKNYRLGIRSAAKSVQDAAEEEMRAIWQDNEHFNQKAYYRMQTKYFQTLATRSRDADIPYSNHYPDRQTFAGSQVGPVPTGCAKLEIIVGRGTSEGGKLGVVVGDPLVARVARDLPGVQYPASLTGSATGVEDVTKRIIQQSKECPDEKFALAGYSQGGGVVSSALKNIPEELRSKVVAVALYGAGDGSKTNELFKSKTIANCAVGDFACATYVGPGHVSYNDEGTKWHDRTAQYISAAYNNKGMGFRLMRDPTAPLVAA